MQKVLIIGAGEIGQAMGGLLKKAGRSTVVFWDADQTKNAQERPLKELLASAEVIFLAVPSGAVRSVLVEIKSGVKKGVPVIVLAKGIEAKSGKTMDQVLREYLPRKQCLLLYGPMIAEEIMAGKATVAVLAARSGFIAKKIIALFDVCDLRLFHWRDLRGVALAGVLKNVYAVGLGILHGLDSGSNFRGWYVAQACLEMGEIIVNLGGKNNTVYSPAGISDLIATGFSSESRNHQAGLDLVKESPAGLQSEGTIAVTSIFDRAKRSKRYVLLAALKAIIVDKEPAKKYFPGVICVK